MIFIMRHGERADNCGPEERATIEIKHDPHLTTTGKAQAFAAGQDIQKRIEEAYKKGQLNTKNPKIVAISSPFLRCLQTTNSVLESFDKKDLYKNCIFTDEGVSEYMNTQYFSECPLNDLYIKNKTQDTIKNKIQFPLKNGYLANNCQSANPCFPENPERLNSRTADAFQKIVDHFIAENNGKKDRVLLIVSHGVPVKGMLTHAMGKMITDKTDYTCLSQVYYRNAIEKPEILCTLSNKHLGLVKEKN